MLFNFFTQYASFFRFAPPDAQQLKGRNVALDWLRVGLFSMVIIHHIGMFYVANWGWHAKSQYQVEWLESVLLVFEPWRLPAIWLISGIAIRIVLAKVSLLRFISMRTFRLLLPLLVGVLVIVPPQLYVEMTLRNEIDMGYWAFLEAFFQTDHPIFENYTWGIWPHIDVNHLWYLRSLWYFSMYLVVLLPLLNSPVVLRLTNWLAKQHTLVIMSIIYIPILTIQLVWGMDEWRYPIGFLFLVYGYLLGWHPELWQVLTRNIRPLALICLLSTITLVIGYNLFWVDIIKGASVDTTVKIFLMVVYSLVRVSGVLLLLGLSTFLATNANKLYQYCNDAVYPFYILHQTVIIVIGYHLDKLQLGPLLQPILLLVGTMLCCVGLYELIRRSDVLRPCFGLKIKGCYSLQLKRIGYVFAAVLISPLFVTLVF